MNYQHFSRLRNALFARYADHAAATKVLALSRCRFSIHMLRKMKFSFFIAHIQQAEAVSVPIQHFYFIAAPVVKYKQSITERVKFKPRLNDRCQPVDRLSHINIRSRYVYFRRFDDYHRVHRLSRFLQILPLYPPIVRLSIRANNEVYSA